MRAAVRHVGADDVRAVWVDLFGQTLNATFSEEESFTAGDRGVLRWRFTFSSRCFTDLMRSPIMRRSSSICVSPGPPRVPMPPRWRSRWLQRRTSRVDR